MPFPSAMLFFLEHKILGQSDRAPVQDRESLQARRAFIEDLHSLRRQVATRTCNMSNARPYRGPLDQPLGVECDK